MKYSASREIDRLVNHLIRAGWRFHRGGKHGKLSPLVGGKFITVPTTPGDRRSARNFMLDLRRVGGNEVTFTGGWRRRLRPFGS
jgi:hypothetical protein